MTDRPARKPSPDLQNQKSLENNLKKTLAEGPMAIPRQVNLILGLSQLKGAKPNTTPSPERPLTISQARIAALTALVGVMNDTQDQQLLHKVSQIKDDHVRLPLVVQLALQLDPEDYQAVMRDAWQQTLQMTDMVARSRTLLTLAPLMALKDDEPAAPSILLEVVALAQSIGNTEARIRSLVALAPHLPRMMGVRLMHRALNDIEQISNDTVRANAISPMTTYLPEELEDQAVRCAMSIESPGDRAQTLTALARTFSHQFHPNLRMAALEAIAAIPVEDDRATALMAFVPYLDYVVEEGEFPELLQAALRIAISLTRRHLRARALVALAPHLTPDLQGEALAAVHGLENATERAALLAQLAPLLPMDMLVASMAVAHTMNEQDARVHALTVIARHLPDDMREQTILDALGAASSLRRPYEKATALIALIDILPDKLRRRTLQQILEAASSIDNENSRSRALAMLGPMLSTDLIDAALDTIYAIQEPQLRLNALIGLLPQLNADHRTQVLRHLLQCSLEMTYEYKRARALVTIAPYLTRDLLHEAIDIANTLSEPFDRASAYIAVAQNLPPIERPRIIDEAWSLIKEIDDGYDRASALSAIAAYLPGRMRGELSQAASMAIGSIMDEYDQASAITILAPLLVVEQSVQSSELPSAYNAISQAVLSTLDVPQQGMRVELLEEAIGLWESLDKERSYDLWRKVAWRMSSLPLADVLLCLGTLTPVIQSLGGDDSLKEIAKILGVR